jgi:anti-sigma regulatory factor (Ser/Thr protein kinase)
VLVVEQDDDRLLVLVRDNGAGGSVAPQEWTPDRVGGRGLLLVQELSDSWSSESTPAGTTVWFELRTGAS